MCQEELRIISELKYTLKKKKKINFSVLFDVINSTDENTLNKYLLLVIEDFINEYNFDTPVFYNKYILKIFDYLNLDETTNNDTIRRLINKINNKLCKASNLNSKVNITSKTFLILLSKQLSYNLTISKDLTSSRESLYDILSNIIYKVKDSSSFEEIISIYPDLINLKKENRYLYYDVFDKYLNILLNSKNENELLYYNRVILIYIKYAKMLENDEIKFYSLRNANRLLESVEYRNFSKEKKNKVILFLKEINNCFNDIKISTNQKINILKSKYNIGKEAISKIKYKPNWKLYKKSKDYAITIDTDDTNIYENAISISPYNKGFKLSFYISDISSLINNNSINIDEILNIGLKVKGQNIFSNKLTDKYFSLNKGKNSYVIDYSFIFNENMEVIDFKVERKVIKVKENLKYSDFDETLFNTKNKKLKKTLLTLSLLSNYIDNDNNELSYHQIKNKVNKLLYDNNSKDVTKKMKVASVMVSKYQIFLNSFFAEYCYKHNLPYLFRNNHFEKEDKVLLQLKDKYDENEELSDLINLVHILYKPSYYSSYNEGHSGLFKEAYGEISKPIRNSASIINQELINMYFIDNVDLNKKDLIKLRRELEKKAEIINNKKEMYDNYFYELKKIKRA